MVITWLSSANMGLLSSGERISAALFSFVTGTGWTNRRTPRYKWGANLDHGAENLVFFISTNCVLIGLSWYFLGRFGLMFSGLGFISTFAVHVIWSSNERIRDKIADGLYSNDYLSKQYQKFCSASDSELRQMGYWEKWALESVRQDPTIEDPCEPKDLFTVVARLPDLRLIHALSLVFLLIHPMLMIRSANALMPGILYDVSGSSTPIDWLIFSLETGTRAFSDIFEIYDISISRITALSDWGLHLMFANRLFFDFILLRSLHREVIIFNRKRRTVHHWPHDPNPAKRLGGRIRKRLEWFAESPVDRDWNPTVVGLAKDHLENLDEWTME